MAVPEPGAANRRQSTRRAPKTWLHASSSLVNGSIVYNVKFWGYTEVSQASGADVVKQAIDRIAAQVAIDKHSGGKTLKAIVAISHKGVRTQDAKTKTTLHVHPLSNISYAGDDKTNKDVFAYITADPASKKFICFAFKSDGWASQMSLTVAQAFDVALRQTNKNLGPGKEAISQRVEKAQKQVEVAATAGASGGQTTPTPAPAPATQSTTPQPVAAVPAPAPAKQEAPKPAPEPAPAPQPAPANTEPAAPTATGTLQQTKVMESVDEPAGDQGYFEPFDFGNTEEAPTPVFGPGIDDIDEAIKSIEAQMGGLVEGFGTGFSL